MTAQESILPLEKHTRMTNNLADSYNEHNSVENKIGAHEQDC